MEVVVGRKPKGLNNRRFPYLKLNFFYQLYMTLQKPYI